MTLSSLGFDITPLSQDEVQGLASKLDVETRRVMIEHGTEAPFCGQFYDYDEDGQYDCALCGLPLFNAAAKFYSRSGWPSFFAPVAEDHIHYIRDTSHGMVRTEIRCARCDGHLGHVFDDGPAPTGQRHCLNSVSLTFVGSSQAQS